MSDISHYLRSDYAGMELYEILHQPLSALLGVGADAVNALKEIGIESVFDLGGSWLFANASAAAAVDQLGTVSERLGLAPSNLLKPTASFETASDIPQLPLEHLSGLTEAEANALKSALDVTTIRDFALWPPRQAAHKLVSDAAGTAIDPEEEESEALRPRFGEYPTERVYYSRLTMLQMGDDSERNPLQQPISLMPTVEQPIGFGKPAVGVLLTSSQSWYARGVTLGHMLHSLALAPGEATRIAVIDWTRRTSTSAEEAITETEKLDNSTLHARAMSEVQNAVATEEQQGGSMSSGWAKSSSLSAAASASTGLIPSLYVSASGSLSYQEASTETFAQSASWSVGSRSISADMTQTVNDRTEQHASSVRNRRATAVREVSQSEHEAVSTRIVANYNHMHALTIQYYEVVQVYQVVSKLHQAERCLFVPFELLDFGIPNAMDIVQRFRGALVRGALTARARDLLIDDTEMVAIKSKLTPSFQRPRLSGVSDERIMALRVSPEGASTSEQPVTASEETENAAVTHAVYSWDRDKLMRISRVIGRSPLRPGSNFLHLPDETELVALSFSGVNLSSVRLARPGIATSDNTFTIPAGTAQVDLPPGILLGDLDAISVSRAADDTLHAGYITLHCSYHGRPLNTVPLPIQLTPGTAMQKIVDFQPDTADRRKELLEHLQANRAHYSQVVFQSLDSATLVMLLSPFTWNGKALIDQIEPNALAIAGNFVVFRAPIEGDDHSGVMSNGNDLTWDAVLEERGINFTISDTRLVPIPTDGVFAEAVLGRSNSAEKLDITRFWNWQDSPIPLQPTEIAPVGTGSRGVAEELTPGSLSSPLLNIVNPTSLPDPAGLSASLGALATANLFRDMSGLQGTQALSEAALKETLEAASEAGQLASKNLQTEAQKAVEMGKIAADVTKAAMRKDSKSSTKGISAEGARINHGRDMDSRRVSVPDSAESGNGVSGVSSDGDASSGGEGLDAGYSREGAYADQGALGYSPDAIRVASGGIASLINSGIAKEASLKITLAPSSWGALADELNTYLNQDSSLPGASRVIELLKKSTTFKRNAKDVGKAYRSKTKNLEEWLGIRSNAYKGKRFLDIQGGDGGSFNVSDYPLTDVIQLPVVNDSDRPRLLVPVIAHEVSHTHAFLSNSSLPKTLVKAIDRGINEEIAARNEEKHILEEIRKADKNAPNFVSSKTIDPAEVEREVSLGTNLTYLEAIVLGFWLNEAATVAQLTPGQVQDIRQDVEASFPNLPTNLQANQSQFAEIYLKKLTAQKAWKNFHASTTREDPLFVLHRNTLANEHVATILDMKVMYRN